MKAIPKTDYQRCFADWKKRWLKCIAANGDYFEGDNLNLITVMFTSVSGRILYGTSVLNKGLLLLFVVDNCYVYFCIWENPITVMFTSVSGRILYGTSVLNKGLLLLFVVDNCYVYFCIWENPITVMFTSVSGRILYGTSVLNKGLLLFVVDNRYVYFCIWENPIIDKAWNGVSQRTLVSAWTKLWPHIVHAYDFKGLSGEQEPPIIDVIVSLGKTLGLEVNEPIIQELVEEEDQELTTNELIDLHREQHQEVKEVISSGEEEDENSLGSLPSDQIRKICKMWETVQLFVAKHHPNKPAALRATDQFNDNAMSHFREILKKRQKQQSLDQFFDKIERKK
ncbi:hypothetical protein LAZ67_8002500 [Cordylochernes scorpioides]|uniref:Uncharacterized protein n=1 Tax=Cordylochernes scorpioides TaxID=51811 RepID=A0ABY6KRG5_9ARAC|nr:hypothetical protein LAZ67_8002500 [Cordylochernes scorpioides]